jgi:hypothetical protein
MRRFSSVPFRRNVLRWKLPLNLPALPHDVQRQFALLFIFHEQPLWHSALAIELSPDFYVFRVKVPQFVGLIQANIFFLACLDRLRFIAGRNGVRSRHNFKGRIYKSIFDAAMTHRQLEKKSVHPFERRTVYTPNYNNWKSI